MLYHNLLHILLLDRILANTADITVRAIIFIVEICYGKCAFSVYKSIFNCEINLRYSYFGQIFHKHVRIRQIDLSSIFKSEFVLVFALIHRLTSMIEATLDFWLL